MSTSTIEDTVRAALRAQMEKKSPTVEVEAIPEAEPEPVSRVTVGEGQKHVDEILKGTKANFAVSIMDRSKYPPALQALIPDADPTYKPNTEIAEAILWAWEHGDKTYMAGPAGVGKSSLVEYLCALTGRPMVRMNMSEDVESSSYLGQLTVKVGEGTVWVDGPVAECAKYGGVFLLDEIDRGTAGNLMPLQWLLEDKGKVFLRDKPGTVEEKTITPHPDFRLVATGNTVGAGDDTGMFASANVLDSATIDRFKTTVNMTYMPAAQEQAMLKAKVPGLSAALAKNITSLAKLVRDGCGAGNITATMSPRVSISWAEKAGSIGVEAAFRLAFLNKLRESDKRVVVEMYRKVFGKQPD